MTKRGTTTRRRDGGILDDLVVIFSRTPVFVPFLVAAVLWAICAFTVRSVPTLGPVLAALVMLTAVFGWIERYRRGRMLAGSRTIEGIRQGPIGHRQGSSLTLLQPPRARLL